MGTDETLDLSGWERRAAARREVARGRLATVAAQADRLRGLLRSCGATEAWIFGSVAAGRARPESDVDVAVAGCAPERFFALAAGLERALDLRLDLVDLDRTPPDFAAEVRRSGIPLLP